MIKFTIFKNSKSKIPLAVTNLDEFVQGIKSGKWVKAVAKLRDTPKESKVYKVLKNNLPAVTLSGLFKSRDEKTPLEKRLKGHTGLICIDVDKKDNPLLKADNVIDNESLLEFKSCSGEGKKIVYYCKEVDNAKEHRRIFDAVIERLSKKGLKVNVDPIVKSIASLQYVSYDPGLYYNPKSKVVIKPLPPLKLDKVKPRSTNPEEDIKQLTEFVEALGNRDITSTYEEWMIVMFGLSYSLGEMGRDIMHQICSKYKDYSEEECNEKYDACLERSSDTDKPVTLNSVYHLINNNIPKVKLKHLSKKHSVTHTIGEAEDIEGADQSDLNGLVRYKLFLFKKVVEKGTGKIIELKPAKLNLNAFETILRQLGFYRYAFNKVKYVHIVDNIVESVDISDILRLLTDYIQKDGDYQFQYHKVEYFYSWEEIAHLWREIRANGSMMSQVTASLTHWEPNLLKDTVDTSFLPYKNGVVEVTNKSIKLLPYAKIKQQIWKERILPRDFTYSTKLGMYEEFFLNTCGRGKTIKEKIKSKFFQRACWYYGYMLQGVKRKSMARAWMLYDIKPGNSGRTGKTILAESIGKIRSMTVIDGKQFDPKNRFAFQAITPWTDVVLIDDPSKYMSIVPLFNMITGTLYADKKGVEGIELNVKFVFSSNWVMEQEGTSEVGRQFVTQIDDFYVRYGKENNDSIKPIVDYHGKELFTDFTAKDWSEFDSFSTRCLQSHLRDAAPENAIVGNSAQVRFIQIHEEEMFYQLCKNLADNVVQGKDGNLLISQALLISAVKDFNEQLNGIKAGRIVKEFLSAIGAREWEISTIVLAGGMTRMAYKLKQPWSGLDLGIMSGKVKIPSFAANEKAKSSSGGKVVGGGKK